MAAIQDRHAEEALARARAAIAAAQSLVALTGAGVSAESGIPTFRDPQTGLWSKFRPQDVASPDAFRRDPAMVWRWYAWRRERVGTVQPNAGHRALAQLEAVIPRFALVTQNVDGLHALCGTRNLIELHGNVLRNRCFDECGVLSDDALVPGEPPRCPHCGALVRPDVVWFGEPLPGEALSRALALSRECDVFLSIGTSTVVEPAASLPFVALDAGACVIEVNPQPTPLTPRASIALAGPAGSILPRLLP